MQFQVPQFIETEDKIVGPLTLKQFFYVAGFSALSFALFFRLDLFVWLLVSAIIIAAGVALAFVQVNGRPLSVFLVASLSYFWQPKVYTFKPRAATPQTPTVSKRQTITPPAGGLKGLLQSLTTSKTAIPRREKPLTESFGILSKKQIDERYQVIRSLAGGSEKARRVDYR
ncbi:MAG: PrgI family protein [Candidatus Colwellbacteria bacterium]|nr:PrgI family protein [Candidatus Colwellbacteria bacterium]